MNIPKRLSKATFENLHGWINWNSEPLRVGDFVAVEDGVMRRMGSIKDDFGIDFDVIPSDAPIDFTSITQKGTTVQLSVGGEVLPTGIVPGDAKGALSVEMKFAEADSFFFKSRSWAFEGLKSTHRVETAMKELGKAGRWNRRYSIVTRALRTSSFLLVASTEAGGSVTFEAKGGLTAGAAVDLGDASLGLVIGAKSSAVITRVGMGGDAISTLLVGLTRLTFWNNSEVHKFSEANRDVLGVQAEEEWNLTDFTPDSTHD